MAKLILSIKLLEGAIADGTAESAAAVPVFVTGTVDFRRCPDVDAVPEMSSLERRLPEPKMIF